MAPRRKKRVKQKETPSIGKKPKEPHVVPNYDANNFRWSVRSADLNGNWGWGQVAISLLFTKIIPKLQNFETMTWGNIQGSGSHFVALDKLCPSAQKRLVQIDMDDFGELFSLRLTGTNRIWGYRERNRGIFPGIGSGLKDLFRHRLKP